MSAPKKIYLQIGDFADPEEGSDDDWMSGNITWCVDKIYDNDIEYVSRKQADDLASALQSLANLDIHHLEKRPDEYPIWAINGIVLTVGDVRKARSVLLSYRKGNNDA